VHINKIGDAEFLWLLILQQQVIWNNRHRKGVKVSDFDKGFELVVGVEGGYESPENAIKNKDPGGETNFGISKRQYPNEDIKNMTLDRAKLIYKRDYWDVVKCEQLPFPLNIFVFDSAVNQGCDKKANFAAQKLLQKTLNLPMDGIIGMQTIQKAQSANIETCALYMADRALRYTGTRNFDVSGRGWLKRLFLIALEVK
jgi:lysozyme family protein